MMQISENDSHAEQVFYNLHYRASILYLRHTSSKLRSFLELFWMLLAVSGFAALICLHLAFVYRGNPTPTSLHNITHHPLRSIPSTCLPSIPGFRRDVDVTHLVLLDDASKDSYAFEVGSFNENHGTNETGVCAATDVSSCVSEGALSTSLEGKVHFSFSRTKGYALLTPNLSSLPNTTHGISTLIVAISKTDARCFGEPFLQQTVSRLLGPDLVMMNWLLAISNGTGYIYNPQTDNTVDLGQYAILNVRNAGFRFSASRLIDLNEWSKWFRPWTSKFRTAVKTCLIYFISTNLVSFLLRVAQERLLELSIQIRSHQQENRSIIPLFVTHVADCFIFIPISIGVLFYLREFYQGDWVIALTVLTVVFVCELFSFVSVRTAQGIFFFPRAFFLLFCLVHFYLFSFPFGFAYVAMGMIVCFMLQCCTFFWNRYEVPAVALGRVPTGMDHRSRMEYSSNTVEGAGAPRDSIQRHQSANVGSQTTVPLPRVPIPSRRVQSGSDPILRVSLHPQYQPQAQIQYTYSQGAFSQGRMSRASSEAIFQRSADADDESENLYLLGGEVVIRRGDDHRWNNGNNSSDSAGDSYQMARYDSSSTLQSAVAQLSTITDEAAASGLQAIHDLTPRLCNLSRGAGTVDSGPGGAPIFPVLDSSRARPRQSKTTTDAPRK